jgi:hypothetical protein
MPYEWTLVADNGAIQHADTRSIAELINRRVGKAHEQEQLHKDASADTPTRLNTQDLWLKKSTHVLKRPKSSAAVAEEGAMPKECLTRHYCQMTHDTILYNKEAAQKDPHLLLT